MVINLTGFWSDLTGLTKMLPYGHIQEVGVCVLYLAIKPVGCYRNCVSIKVLAVEGSTQVSCVRAFKSSETSRAVVLLT